MSQTSFTKRDPFSFEIAASELRCTIGDKTIVLGGCCLPPPTKNKSKVSVISVYDVYGLEVTYAFLKHLHTKEGDKTWIATYLSASLLILDERTESAWPYMRMEDKILHLTTTLLYYLKAMDDMQPRVSESTSETALVLPVELIARITNNPTLCCEVRDQVKLTRAMPSEKEMGEHR